jgi:hypothetical protein
MIGNSTITKTPQKLVTNFPYLQAIEFEIKNKFKYFRFSVTDGN